MSGHWSQQGQGWQPPSSVPPPPLCDTFPAPDVLVAGEPYRFHDGTLPPAAPPPPMLEPPPPMPEPYQLPEPQLMPQLPPPPPLPPIMPPPLLTYAQYRQQTSATGSAFPKGENPREMRNKAEKKRRDKLNQSIAELAALVPPVIAAHRRIDKTAVLRLTAHYLRAHQYIFCKALMKNEIYREVDPAAVDAFMKILNGFLLTTTYKGLIVVVSQNVRQYLGYNELDLFGQSILNITHEDDRQMLREQLMPRSVTLGPNGELLLPDGPDGRDKINELLGNERRHFVVRFKKLTNRSEPDQYVSCQVDGSMRVADHANLGSCQTVRRARARSVNPCNSGNDVVFIGMARPSPETFLSERRIEAYRMEYRTRHAVDGQIVQCEQKISLVTGYMTHEVHGLNAMSFMHRDDVRWVIMALRDMYDEQRRVGESCYRLMTKNGQFIYMRTRGYLEVDEDSRAVTTFLCNNAVVDEAEGKYLIQQMKSKFRMLIDSKETPEKDQPESDEADCGGVPVEDPRQLERVILHLVTDLPSAEPVAGPSGSSGDPTPPSTHLNIIPPEREDIVSSIGKFYEVIKGFTHTPKAQPSTTAQADQGSVNIDAAKAGPSGETQGALKRKMQNDMPVLNTSEEALLKRSYDGQEYKGEDLARYKVSDQVLGAVQLQALGPAFSWDQKKQACDQEVDENGYMYQRKVFEFPQPEYAPLAPLASLAPVDEPPRIPAFELGGFDCPFDENGLEDMAIMESLIGSGTSSDIFPDILQDNEFQELFEDIENSRQLGANGSST